VNKSEKYLGNSNLKAAGVNVNFSEKQIAEYVKCSQDPLYFIKNYVKIVSLDKGLVPFEPYDFQEEIVRKVHNNRFVIAKLPRQSGKSTTVVASLLHYILFRD
jgi:superfamily II DNA or RNA helicase